MKRRSQSREGGVLNIERLPGRKPKTKSGQIRWVWPEILAALATGHNLKNVWEELGRDGIELSYWKFRFYVARLRKAERAFEASGNADPYEDHHSRPESKAARVRDPLANLRERTARRPGFEYDESPPDESKLI